VSGARTSEHALVVQALADVEGELRTLEVKRAEIVNRVEQPFAHTLNQLEIEVRALQFAHDLKQNEIRAYDRRAAAFARKRSAAAWERGRSAFVVTICLGLAILGWAQSSWLWAIGPSAAAIAGHSLMRLMVRRRRE